MNEQQLPNKGTRGTRGKKKQLTWQRVDAVINLILENDRYLQKGRYKELAETVAAKFEVQSRQAKRYIAEARKEINRIGKQHAEKALTKAIRDREYLLNIAKNGIKDKDGKYLVKPNHKLALEILKDREQINGLYVQKYEHSGSLSLRGVDLSRLTDEDLSALEGLQRRGEDLKPFLISKGIKVD